MSKAKNVIWNFPRNRRLTLTTNFAVKETHDKSYGGETVGAV